MPELDRGWIDVLAGNANSELAPLPWQQWVNDGQYQALKPMPKELKTPDEQLSVKEEKITNAFIAIKSEDDSEYILRLKGQLSYLLKEVGDWIVIANSADQVITSKASIEHDQT